MSLTGCCDHEYFSTGKQKMIIFLSFKDQRLTPFKNNQRTKLPLGLLTFPAARPVKLDVNT